MASAVIHIAVAKEINKDLKMKYKAVKKFSVCMTMVAIVELILMIFI